MTATAAALLTYLWHYLLARTLYDRVVLPLERGDTSQLLLLGTAAGIAFLLGRMSNRRRPR